MHHGGTGGGGTFQEGTREVSGVPEAQCGAPGGYADHTLSGGGGWDVSIAVQSGSSILRDADSKN